MSLTWEPRNPCKMLSWNRHSTR